jgi:hypothetical protein
MERGLLLHQLGQRHLLFRHEIRYITNQIRDFRRYTARRTGYKYQTSGYLDYGHHLDWKAHGRGVLRGVGSRSELRGTGRPAGNALFQLETGSFIPAQGMYYHGSFVGEHTP